MTKFVACLKWKGTLYLLLTQRKFGEKPRALSPTRGVVNLMLFNPAHLLRLDTETHTGGYTIHKHSQPDVCSTLHLRLTAERVAQGFEAEWRGVLLVALSAGGASSETTGFKLKALLHPFQDQSLI